MISVSYTHKKLLYTDKTSYTDINPKFWGIPYFQAHEPVNTVIKKIFSFRPTATQGLGALILLAGYMMVEYRAIPPSLEGNSSRIQSTQFAPKEASIASLKGDSEMQTDLANELGVSPSEFGGPSEPTQPMMAEPPSPPPSESPLVIAPTTEPTRKVKPRLKRVANRKTRIASRAATLFIEKELLDNTYLGAINVLSPLNEYFAQAFNENTAMPAPGQAHVSALTSLQHDIERVTASLQVEPIPVVVAPVAPNVTETLKSLQVPLENAPKLIKAPKAKKKSVSHRKEPSKVTRSVAAIVRENLKTPDAPIQNERIIVQPEPTAPPARLAHEPTSDVEPIVSHLDTQKPKNILSTPVPLKSSSVTTHQLAKTSPPPVGNQLLPIPKVEPTVESNQAAASVTGPFRLFGQIRVEQSLATKLEATGGHIELRLYSKSRTEAPNFIPYQYPAEQFEVDVKEWFGPYRLSAVIYNKEHAAPLFEVFYSQSITEENYKSQIRFDISDRKLATSADAISTHQSALTMTVFEGASGNFRDPKPIANATIRIVGLDSKKIYSTDQDGNLILWGLPTKSEYLIEVEAKGYYPTQKVVILDSARNYIPVYLVSTDKVESIRYFSGKPQLKEKAFLMGRVFDPTTKDPLSSETLELSHRKGKPLYFGSLPDPQLSSTTETGLFGFFNIAPSVRFLTRSEVRAPWLFPVKSGYGYYVELGRSGENHLRARLYDPFLAQPVLGSVRLLGSKSDETAANDDGSFILPDIDLPSGVLPIEVRAEGYPTTWQMLRWDRSIRASEPSLFMMNETMWEQTLKDGGPVVDRSLGSLLGGAQASFFDKIPGCYVVTLMDSNGKALPASHGPFAVGSERGQANYPLCLSHRSPAFNFVNLPDGAYTLQWMNPSGKLHRSRYVYIGRSRVTVVIN